MMVNPLADTASPPLIDHIGVALWQAALDWRQTFADHMIAHGHGIFAGAASNALAYIGPKGIRQSSLALQMGITKQAAQQFIDQLEAQGIVTRLPDPDDNRAKRVVLSAQGAAMMTHANTVKRAIEDHYRATLGPDRFRALTEALALITPPQNL